MGCGASSVAAHRLGWANELADDGLLAKAFSASPAPDMLDSQPPVVNFASYRARDARNARRRGAAAAWGCGGGATAVSDILPAHGPSAALSSCTSQPAAADEEPVPLPRFRFFAAAPRAPRPPALAAPMLSDADRSMLRAKQAVGAAAAVGAQAPPGWKVLQAEVALAAPARPTAVAEATPAAAANAPATSTTGREVSAEADEAGRSCPLSPEVALAPGDDRGGAICGRAAAAGASPGSLAVAVSGVAKGGASERAVVEGRSAPTGAVASGHDPLDSSALSRMRHEYWSNERAQEARRAPRQHLGAQDAVHVGPGSFMFVASQKDVSAHCACSATQEKGQRQGKDLAMR